MAIWFLACKHLIGGSYDWQCMLLVLNDWWFLAKIPTADCVIGNDAVGSK